MKNRHVLALLKKQDQTLQLRHLESYLRMLEILCRGYESYSELSAFRSLLESRDFNSLLALADSWSKQLYTDRREHFLKNQLSALVKKYPWGRLVKADPEASALEKFVKAEHYCSRINQRFKARRAQRPSLNEGLLQRMRDFIVYTIGTSPNLDAVLSRANFGPGASIGISRSTNNARKLLASEWTVTPGAFEYGFAAIMKNVHARGVLSPSSAPFMSGSPACTLERDVYAEKTRMIRHNKITFVPKTALVHRTIAIEPLINGFIQKGVDDVLRVMLKRVGVDLSNQEPNQEYARKGSIPGEEDPFCTIDLSSASDSIATEVVREILPFDWFYLLNGVRSKEYELKGKFYTYHKFCSMGNGFCFPLESLIFTAACVSVGAGQPGKDFQVYGDDIIVRRSVYKPLVELLLFLGFKINKEKTFSQGPFRESCGADWFEGEDVRPFTLDFTLESVQSIFKVLNLSRRNARTEMFFYPARPFLLGLLPEALRFYRPHPRAADTGIDATGDEHLLSNNCFFDRKQMHWVCREVSVAAIQDRFWLASDARHVVEMWGALVGAASTAPFSFRGKTRAKVCWKANSESHSTWVPPAVR